MAEFIVGSPIGKFARRHPRLRRMLWRVDFVLVWVLVQVYRIVPVAAAARLGDLTGRLIGPRMKRKHELFRQNLETVFPEKTAAEIDELLAEAWGRAGRVLAEYPHLAKFVRDEKHMQIDIRERLPAYDRGGKPCVVVTAHVSNWEMVACAMGRLGMPNSSLYSPASNPYLDRMLAKSREALNSQLLARDNSARLLLRALKQGRSTGFVCDRRMKQGDKVKFFGRDKVSTLAPAKLALKFNCPMVPVQVVRSGEASYRVIFHRPIQPRDKSASEAAQALDMIQQLHEHFEDWIRQNPADWLASKRLWAPEDATRNRSENQLVAADPSATGIRMSDNESNAA